MIERFYVTPESTYKTGGNNKVLSTPVVVVKTSELAHIFVAGRTARLPNGDVHPKGDMRGQIRLVCENIQVALDSVGGDLRRRGSHRDLHNPDRRVLPRVR